MASPSVAGSSANAGENAVAANSERQHDAQVEFVSVCHGSLIPSVASRRRKSVACGREELVPQVFVHRPVLCLFGCRFEIGEGVVLTVGEDRVAEGAVVGDPVALARPAGCGCGSGSNPGCRCVRESWDRRPTRCSSRGGYFAPRYPRARRSRRRSGRTRPMPGRGSSAGRSSRGRRGCRVLAASRDGIAAPDGSQ